jgi:hypothetical protein
VNNEGLLYLFEDIAKYTVGTNMAKDLTLAFL